MISYFGDFAEDDTVLIPFNTFDSNDPSASVTVTDLVDADIKVHKDGGTTQIATDGATVAIDYDSITGNHLVTIDTSAHSDYATGSEYAVRVEGVTVDGGTLNAWIGAFSIERAGGALAVIKLIQTAVITNAAGTDVAADIIAVKAQTAAIETDTGQIGTAGAGLSNINLPNQTMDIVGDITGNLSGSVGSVTGAVGSVTGSVGSNVELGPAEVNAEVVDALNVDTYAEPAQGAPAATASLVNKIGFLYKAWRNRSNQNATTFSLYNDDAVTVDHKVTVSDDGSTAEKGEVGTGP